MSGDEMIFDPNMSKKKKKKKKKIPEPSATPAT